MTPPVQAYCGLGTLTTVLNALAIDPGRLWKGDPPELIHLAIVREGRGCRCVAVVLRGHASLLQTIGSSSDRGHCVRRVSAELSPRLPLNVATHRIVYTANRPMPLNGQACYDWPPLSAALLIHLMAAGSTGGFVLPSATECKSRLRCLQRAHAIACTEMHSAVPQHASESSIEEFREVK